jgi:hypothetical protein
MCVEQANKPTKIEAHLLAAYLVGSFFDTEGS